MKYVREVTNCEEKWFSRKTAGGEEKPVSWSQIKRLRKEGIFVRSGTNRFVDTSGWDAKGQAVRIKRTVRSFFNYIPNEQIEPVPTGEWAPLDNFTLLYIPNA